MGDRLLTALAGALEALKAAEVEFALIGGFAAAVRGRLRFTQDLDVLALCESAQQARLIRAFRHRGFAHHDRADHRRLDEVDLLRFWLPVATTGVSIGVDVQMARSPSVANAVSRAVTETYQGLSIPVATREDLILLKLIAWRPIDRADAIELAAVSPATLDWTFLQTECQIRGLGERLAELEPPPTP